MTFPLKLGLPLGKFPSLKKSSFLLQSRHYLTTQSQIGQSICSEEVEKDSIPKFVVTLWFIGQTKMLLSSKDNPNVIEVVLTTTSLTHRHTPAFHDFNAGFDRPIDGGNNSSLALLEWQLLIQAKTTKQLIREKSLACIGKTRDGTQV